MKRRPQGAWWARGDVEARLWGRIGLNGRRGVGCRRKLRGKRMETDLFLDVIQRIWRVYCETDEDDVGVGIGERTKTIVIFLSSGIP